jgi:hypothetical protein
MYGKDEGEYSGAFTPDNENAEKSRLQFLATLKLIGISYRANQNPVIDSNGNIMGYEAAKSHYAIRGPDRRSNGGGLF